MTNHEVKRIKIEEIKNKITVYDESVLKELRRTSLVRNKKLNTKG